MDWGEILPIVSSMADSHQIFSSSQPFSHIRKWKPDRSLIFPAAAAKILPRFMSSSHSLVSIRMHPENFILKKIMAQKTQNLPTHPPYQGILPNKKHRE
jgi:hypothetical protein